MKRITTILFGVLAAVLLGSPVQAQSASRKVLLKSHTHLTRPVNSALLRALKAKATSEQAVLKRVDAALKKGVSTTPLATLSVNYRSDSGIRVQNVCRELPQQAPLKAAPRRAGEVVDAHGIITSPAEGTTKYYSRQGYGYYLYWGSLYYTEQSGHVEIVECEDGTVYVKDLISGYSVFTWLKGTKTGNTLTIACGQPFTYSDRYDATVDLSWWRYDEAAEEFVLSDKTDVTFTIDGNVLTLQDSSEDFVVGGKWSDDDSFFNYSDYETVWTLDAAYEPAATELVELPQGIVPDQWTVSGVLNDESKLKGEVNVAITDDEVYIQGLFKEHYPESWIKGTINGTEVTFPALQFLGTYDLYNIWAAGSEDGETLSDFVMDYDAEAGVLTAVTPYLLANAADDRVYPYDYITDLVLQADLSAEPTAKTGAPIDVLPYVNSFDTEEEQAAFGILNSNGDTDYYGDEKTWYFSDEGEALCSYGDEALDDWLISPAIKLEAGKYYPVSFNTRANSSYFPERVELRMGTKAKASALSKVVIEPTVVDWVGNQLLEAYVTVETTGYYHFGIHAISDAGMWRLYVDDFTVGEEVPLTAPGAPRVIAQADPYGADKAVITVAAPTFDLGGDLITGLSKLEVYSDGDLIKVFDEVEPMGTYVFSDKFIAGNHTYYAVAYNADGVGGQKSKFAKAYVGLDAPAEATITSVVTAPGQVTVNWETPEKGEAGGYINADEINYGLWSTTYELLWGMFPYYEADELLGEGKGNSITVDYDTESGEQRWEVLDLIAENETGYTETYVEACVGEAYTLPIAENFAGSQVNYAWYGGVSPNADIDFGNLTADEDGVGIIASSTKGGEFAYLELGKVKVSGQNPVLTFQAIGDAGNKVLVRVQKNDGSKELVAAVPVGEDYNLYTVSLKDYVNEPYVALFIEANFAGEGSVGIDDIRLFNQLDYNIAATLSAPASVQAGSAAPFVVTVRNDGSKIARNFKLKVTALKSVYREYEFSTLNPGKSVQVEFDYPVSMFFNDNSLAVTATVEYDDDLDLEDNTASAIVEVKHSTAAQPTGVKAVKSGDAITVSWDAVAADAVEQVTEDFSSYESEQWENLGDWTLVNANGAPKGRIFDEYVLANEGKASSFIVIKPSVLGIDDESFYGPSGSADEAYVSSIYNADGYDYPDNDDWLISPVLSGNAQTVKFFVGATSVYFGSSLYEVLYSTSSNDIASFTKIAEGELDEEGWKEVSVDLPAGATYFAIRNVTGGDEAYMFNVANVRFEKPAAPVAKYNIWAYLDSWTLVDDVPGTANSVELKGADVLKAVAVAVSAVYTTGQESKPVVVQITGSNKDVTAIQELLTNGKTFDVYTLDGKLVRSQALSLQGLKGAFIIDGRKVILK